MKHISESIIGKRGTAGNPYGLTEKDLIGGLRGIPMGVVVRMLEEQEKQGSRPDVKVFQRDRRASRNQYGFNWDDTVNGWNFWHSVLDDNYFDFIFFDKYPKYRKYNI